MRTSRQNPNYDLQLQPIPRPVVTTGSPLSIAMAIPDRPLVPAEIQAHQSLAVRGLPKLTRLPRRRQALRARSTLPEQTTRHSNHKDPSMHQSWRADFARLRQSRGPFSFGDRVRQFSCFSSLPTATRTRIPPPGNLTWRRPRKNLLGHPTTVIIAPPAREEDVGRPARFPDPVFPIKGGGTALGSLLQSGRA